MGHLRSEGKAGVLGGRGRRGDRSGSCHGTWTGGLWTPLAAVHHTSKGTEPPPPNARPKTVATLFNTSHAKPDQGGPQTILSRASTHPKPQAGCWNPETLSCHRKPNPCQAGTVPPLPHRHPALGGLSARGLAGQMQGSSTSPEDRQGPESKEDPRRVQELPRGPRSPISPHPSATSSAHS